MATEVVRRVKVPVEDFLKFDSGEDPFFYRTKYLYNIRTEKGEITTFTPNSSQTKLHLIGEAERRRTFAETLGMSKRFNCIILKPRQVGFTTYTSVYISDLMMNLQQCRAMVLSHNEKDQTLIWDKYYRVFHYFPDILEIVDERGKIIQEVKLRPTYDRFSDSNIKFANFTESELYVRHAGSKDNVGKGDTINAVHLTEAANYADYNVVKASLSQQIPLDAPEALFVIESTANGMTGIGEGFYNEWKKAEASWADYQSGKTKNFTGFVPFFVPWYHVEKYRRPVLNGELYSIEQVNFHPLTKKEYLEQESRLREEFGVTEDQINWYRWNLVERCNHELTEAYRYYPTFPEEAFLGTTQSYFNANKLHVIRNDVSFMAGRVSGFLDDDGYFVEEFGGPLIIKKMPESGYYGRYYIGMDISTGKTDGDYTVMCVYDRLEDEFVAEWRGLIREDLAAEELVKLGAFYNYAKLNPEANLATVVNLIRPDGFLPYEGEIYVRKYTLSGEPEYGYLTKAGTSPGSRNALLVNYKAWIEPKNGEDNYRKLCTITSVNEHIAFVRKIKGNNTRYEADTDQHDDLVIGHALAIWQATHDESAIQDFSHHNPEKPKVVEGVTRQRKKKHGGLSLSKVGTR